MLPAMEEPVQLRTPGSAPLRDRACARQPKAGRAPVSPSRAARLRQQQGLELGDVGFRWLRALLACGALFGDHCSILLRPGAREECSARMRCRESGATLTPRRNFSRPLVGCLHLLLSALETLVRDLWGGK